MPTKPCQTSSKRPVSIAAKEKARRSLTFGAKATDICLVVVWGAMIPGLMWLGAAGGF
jgi:hypothetical protein